MLQSLLALPLGALLEAGLFALLYLFTPATARQAAVIVLLLSLGGLLLLALLDWPGADVLAMYVAVFAVTAYVLGVAADADDRRRRADGATRRWFHWGPAAIILFFVVLFTLDGVLVVISSRGLPEPVAAFVLPGDTERAPVNSVFPGVVARDYQKKESLYNAYLEQVREQQQRGWQVRKGWLQTPVAGAGAPFRVEVRENDGTPVRFAEVSGVFQRPSDSRLDRPFVLQEDAPGSYGGDLVLPQPGVWRLVLQIRRGEQLHELHATTSIEARQP
jgi:nitrogen fixation protein FixH